MGCGWRLCDRVPAAGVPAPGCEALVCACACVCVLLFLVCMLLGLEKEEGALRGGNRVHEREVHTHDLDLAN